MKEFLTENKRTIGVLVAFTALYVSSKVPALNDLHEYIYAALAALGFGGIGFLKPLKKPTE